MSRVTRTRHPVPARPALVNRTVMEVVFGLRAAAARWGRPDVVVLVTPALFSSAIASVRARLGRTPSVAWVQDIYSLGVAQSGTGGGFAGRVARAIEGRLLRSASGVIVIHDRFKRYVVAELGVDPDRVTVVRNWTHVDAVDPARARADPRASRLAAGRDHRSPRRQHGRQAGPRVRGGGVPAGRAPRFARALRAPGRRKSARPACRRWARTIASSSSLPSRTANSSRPWPPPTSCS